MAETSILFYTTLIILLISGMLLPTFEDAFDEDYITGDTDVWRDNVADQEEESTSWLTFPLKLIEIGWSTSSMFFWTFRLPLWLEIVFLVIRIVFLLELGKMILHG